MELDAGHQQLKHQLMAAFARASRSVDATHKKTCEVRIAFDEEVNNTGSRIFKLTQRINGAKKLIQETESPTQPVEGEEEDDEEEEAVHADDLD